jgi:hypothetical protein
MNVDQRPQRYSHLRLSKSFPQSIQHRRRSSLPPKTRHFSSQSRSAVARSQFLSSLFSMPALRSGSRGIYTLVVSYLSVLTFCFLGLSLASGRHRGCFGQDPEHICILQGPVAAKQSKIKDEPIKDLLGNINSSLVNNLLQRVYGGDASKIPTIDYLGKHCRS